MKSYLLNAVNLEIEYQEKLMKRVLKRRKELSDVADLSLIANYNGNGRKQYYIQEKENGKSIRKYLGKKDTGLVKNLQEKRYIDKVIPNCVKNLEMLKMLRDSYYPTNPREVMASMPLAYQEQEQANDLVYKYRNSERWKAAKLAIKDSYPVHRAESLRHVAIDGTITRSKSEAVILNLLVEKEIPFVYEVPMRFNGILKSPDFLIYDRKNNREVILEHMGRMDLENYRDNQYDKIGLYISSGWVPNVNLILTFEDVQGNINIPAISRTIDSILL